MIRRTGRWRAVYVVDYAKGTIEGNVKLNTHYYEQGKSLYSCDDSTIDVVHSQETYVLPVSIIQIRIEQAD